jgi:hypothetical protein
LADFETGAEIDGSFQKRGRFGWLMDTIYSTHPYFWSEEINAQVKRCKDIKNVLFI